MKDIVPVKIPTPKIEHKGPVQMGAYTPAFPPIRAQPTSAADKGKIRMGAYTPPFPGTPAK